MHSRYADNFVRFEKLGNTYSMEEPSLSESDKIELVKVLKEENKKLKSEIAKLREREQRLEQRISGLEVAAAIGRRGPPW